MQEKISLLDSLATRQEVTVTFDIRGREYNGRYDKNLQGWNAASAADSDDFNQEQPPSDSSDFDDDIPF